MSDTITGLNRKISIAKDLQTVVRTMKAIASSSVGQYEKSILSLGEYYRTVQLGLSVCCQAHHFTAPLMTRKKDDSRTVRAIVFGSDQGLVGRFNDVVTDYAIQALPDSPENLQIWVVGERAYARLYDAGFPLKGLFRVPNSAKAITPLIGQILLESEPSEAQSELEELHLFYNSPTSGAIYEPIDKRLLPLDETWRQDMCQLPWPTNNLAEVVADDLGVLRALIREYLFISIFRACAESLASENSSRLEAMQRADKNIEDLLEELNGAFHSLRQSNIDQELFDVISGYESTKVQSAD